MISCQTRFMPTVATMFFYALLMPLGVFLSMGFDDVGFRWVRNDPAYSAFMVAAFPFAAAMFMCSLDLYFLRKQLPSSNVFYQLVTIGVVFGVVLTACIAADLIQKERPYPPYMIRDHQVAQALAHDHQRILDFEKTSNLSFDNIRELQDPGRASKLEPAAIKERQDLKNLIDAYNLKSRDKSEWPATGASLSFYLEFVYDLINGGIPVAFLWYLLAILMTGQKTTEKQWNHYLVTLLILSLWFPARAYSEWYLRFHDGQWLFGYPAYIVLIFAYALAAIVLSLKVAGGNLWSKLTLISATGLGILAVLAKVRPDLLSSLAVSITTVAPQFQFGIMAIFAVLIYVCCVLVHIQPD